MDAIPESHRRHIAHKRHLLELSRGHTIVISSEIGPVTHPDFSSAILARDPRCFLVGGNIPSTNGILHIPQHPYICCVYNQQGPWAAHRLHLVCGSLGLGLGHSPWYAFGNPGYTTYQDFMAGHPVAWNWHVWLENEAGRIWDICEPIWHDLAAAHGHRILLGDTAEAAVIDGETLDDLEAKGLHYKPAHPAIQHTLLDAARCLFAPVYSFIKTTH